jgi:3-hydroxyisobutyrate dehydrogenase
MGAAIASRLLGLGHEVTVWNRTGDKARALAAAGAKVAATPAELASRTEIVISIVSDAGAIDTAYHGPSGLLSGDVRGKLFIDMSTVRPGAEQALAAAVRDKGAALIDCPVGGTIGPAREGKLFGFVGGDPADVARAKPLLDQMCRHFEHVGPVGAGASLKLAINLPLYVYWQVLGEALSLCQHLGLEPARVIDIMSDTSGGPNVLKGRGPTIAAALRGEDTGPVSSDVELARKDLKTMTEEAATLGVRLPVTSRALECMEEAARAGLGASDNAVLAANWIRSGRNRSEQAGAASGGTGSGLD